MTISVSRGLPGLALLFGLAACLPEAPPVRTGTASAMCHVTYVVDGDTLHLDCGAGERKVRLLGFDAPEVFHPHCPAEAEAGRRATAALRALVASGPVTSVRTQGHDRYGRDLDWLSIAGRDVTQSMLATPYALPYAGHAHPDWCARL